MKRRGLTIAQLKKISKEYFSKDIIEFNEKNKKWSELLKDATIISRKINSSSDPEKQKLLVNQLNEKLAATEKIKIDLIKKLFPNGI